jgi:hypothetical protein
MELPTSLAVNAKLLPLLLLLASPLSQGIQDGMMKIKGLFMEWIMNMLSYRIRSVDHETLYKRLVEFIIYDKKNAVYRDHKVVSMQLEGTVKKSYHCVPALTRGTYLRILPNGIPVAIEFAGAHEYVNRTTLYDMNNNNNNIANIYDTSGVIIATPFIYKQKLLEWTLEQLNSESVFSAATLELLNP